MEIKIKEALRTATELMNATWMFIYEAEIKKVKIKNDTYLNGMV